MEIRVLARRGVGIRETARQHGCSCNTVRRYLAAVQAIESMPPSPERTSRSNKRVTAIACELERYRLSRLDACRLAASGESRAQRTTQFVRAPRGRISPRSKGCDFLHRVSSTHPYRCQYGTVLPDYRTEDPTMATPNRTVARAFVKEWRIERGLSQDQLAAACGGTTCKSAISRLERGNRRLTLDWMQRIAKALDLPTTALTVHPDVYRREGSTARDDAVSLRDLAGCEDGEIAQIEVRTDSMVPTLSPGDRILVDRQQRSLAAGIYAIDLGHGAEIKRLMPIGQRIRLTHDNKVYESLEVDAGQVRVLGRVVTRICLLYTSDAADE